MVVLFFWWLQTVCQLIILICSLTGARGAIVDIILHSDKPPVGDQPIIKLKCLPAYILVKLMRTRAMKLDGLQEGVIPVKATLKTSQISVFVAGKHQKRTVHQQQFQMTAAHSFTDYQSQGQTIHYVVVDIAQPPMGTLSLFNLHVALLGARDGTLFNSSGISMSDIFKGLTNGRRWQAGENGSNHKGLVDKDERAQS